MQIFIMLLLHFGVHRNNNNQFHQQQHEELTSCHNLKCARICQMPVVLLIKTTALKHVQEILGMLCFFCFGHVLSEVCMMRIRAN